MNRVFALTVVMSMSVYAASPTPTTVTCYSPKFWQTFDKINLDNETYESQEEIIRKVLAKFHYVYAEMEEAECEVLVRAARDGLAEKWWATHSRVSRAKS